MVVTSFTAITIFGNLASFMIGKYVRNYVIDNPCTKPCGKLSESMFISSIASFSDITRGHFSRKGAFFSRNYLESGSTLSN